MLIRSQRSWLGIAAAGLVGAGALTALQYWTRDNVRGAPRLDKVGERLLSRGMRRVGLKPLHGRSLVRAAMIGDFATNGLLFGLLVAGRRRGLVRRGITAGVIASLGTMALAPRLGLGRRAVRTDLKTGALTVGLYTAGGLASAGASRLLAPAPL